MAASLSFDINGSPVTINTPLGNLRWQKTPVYVGVGTNTLFNYIMLVSFNDGTIDRTLELRLYTDTIAAITYEPANQGTLTESTDIALCNSMYMRTMLNNEVYNSDANAQIIVSAVSSTPDCIGTFSGDLLLYRGTPIINSSNPVLTDPTVIDTISITNGSFTDIPFIL